MTNIFRNKDFLGGCLLIAVGAVAAFIASGYAFGTPRQMGPGFLPIVLASILMGLGLILALKSATTDAQLDGTGTLRPIFVVLGAVLVFSQILEPVGLVLSSLLLVLIACAAQSPFKLREALILAIGLTVGVVLLFAFALGIPFRLWPAGM